MSEPTAPISEPSAEAPVASSDTNNTRSQAPVSSPNTAAAATASPTPPLSTQGTAHSHQHDHDHQEYPSSESSWSPANTTSSSPQPPTGTGTGTASTSTPTPTPTSTNTRRATARINVTTTQPNGINGRRFSVDRNTGQVRINMGQGNVVTVPLHRQPPSPLQQNGGGSNSTNTNNNTHTHTHAHHSPHGPVNVRVVQLDPLMPSLLPDASQNLNQQTQDHVDVDEEEALAQFKCSICCEFMKEPVGCGSSSNCASRFCHVCLIRVAKEAHPQKPKCPTCRVEFTTLHRDQRLRHELHHPTDAPTLPCRFRGCTERLKLPLIANHEQTCAHAQLACRYATFGCPWKGKRGAFAAHEGTDCHLARVSKLVNEFRKLKADHQSRLEIVQQQTVGSIRMMNVHRQNLQRDQLKSTSNLVHLLLYCYSITCLTPHFLFTRDRWVSLFRSNEGRAGVVNCLVFLPTMLLCATTAATGVQNLFQVLDDIDHNYNDNHQQQQQSPFLLEDALICICIGFLGTLLMAANFVDGKSSQHWRKFPFPHMGKSPVMCDILAVSTFTIHLSVLEYHGAGTKSFLLWIVLALTTTFFPALVITLSHAAARNMMSTPPPTVETMCSLARSVEPFLFGLRYSVLATFAGILPCMDAAILSVLLPQILNRVSHRFLLKNCFLEAVPKSFIVAYFGARTAMLSAQMRVWMSETTASTSSTSSNGGIPDSLLWTVDSIFAVAILLVLNLLINQFFAVGIWLGNKIATQAHVDVRPNGLQKDYNLLGMVSFGAWTCLLGLLLQFR